MKPNTVVWASALGLVLAIGGAVNTKPVSANESLPSINAKQVSKMPLIATFKSYVGGKYIRYYVFYLQSLRIMQLPNKDKIYHIEINTVGVDDQRYKFSPELKTLLLSENRWNSCVANNKVPEVYASGRLKKLTSVDITPECYGGSYVEPGTKFYDYDTAKKQLTEIVTATNNLIKIINSNGGNLKYLPKK